jgi:signal transduction histidine kinase
LVVLETHYIESTFLPRLVKLHFPKATSDYDILVLEKVDAKPSRIVFHSESAPPEREFAHPDGNASLLQLRLDCFLPSLPPSGARFIQNPSGVTVVRDGPGLTEILTRRPPACGAPGPTLPGNSGGLWKILIRYRAGSLDQVIASFRHKNILLGGSVLLVLALGIAALVASMERARVLAQMQNEFALGVSHELRTPLTVIRVAADNLKKGMVENPEQASKYGDIIDRQASELANMVEQSLAFGRIQSKAFVPDAVPVSPEQIVNIALANCHAALQDAGIKVELDIATDLPLVDVDVPLMNRCLENLIHNAAKYAAAGRWMALRVKKVDKAEEVRVQISVEDRGSGISPADLPRVFEPFFRGKHGVASHVPGVGLGLTLVKRVIEGHNGTVEVQSSEVHGTSFSLFLPPHGAKPDAQNRA